MPNKKIEVILITLIIIAIVSVGFFIIKNDSKDRNSCVVTFAFDDGYTNQYNNALPVLEKYGVPATFNIIASLVGKQFEGENLMDWNQIKELKEKGHDIESHTNTHPYLTKLSEEEVRKELRVSKKILIDRGFSVSSLAIPYGDYNKEVLKIASQNYSLVRSSDPGINNLNKLDKYNLKSKVIRNNTSFKEISNSINNCSEDQWLILMYHIVRKHNSKEYSTSPEKLEKIIKFIKEKNIPIKTISQITLEP